MKWIALVYVTPLSSLLSLSKLVPDVSSSFHQRGKIASVYVSLCVKGKERKMLELQYNGVGEKAALG